MFDLLMKIRFVRRQAWHLEKRRIKRQIRGSANAEEAFRVIYKSNFWRSAESISGNGSTLASTAVFRAEFEPLLHARRVATLFDAPCGDFNWMKQVKFPDGMKYIGADIVGELIELAEPHIPRRRRQDLLGDGHHQRGSSQKRSMAMPG